MLHFVYSKDIPRLLESYLRILVFVCHKTNVGFLNVKIMRYNFSRGISFPNWTRHVGLKLRTINENSGD